MKKIGGLFFKKSNDNNSVVCSLCKKEFKYYGNTTNMKKHIQRIHPLQWRENSAGPSSSAEDKEQCEVPIAITETKVGTDENLLTLQEPCSSKRKLEINAVSDKKPSKQLKLFGVKNTISDAKKKEINCKLLKMVTIDYQPLSIVENIGFQEYTKALNSHYMLPSRKILTENMIPKQYSECVSKLKQMLLVVKYVSITTDIWTSDSCKAYISITIHFIYNDKMCSFNIATKEIVGSHTGENIGLVLIKILEEWQLLEKILTVVSDNGSNIKKAINEYVKKHHHPCVAHTLNLGVTDAIQLNEIFTKILKKCRSIVGHFKHSVVATEKLKNTQIQMNTPILKVKQDVVTRWNSCLIMIERLLKIKDSLAVCITNLPKAPVGLDASEWLILEDCASILKPPEKLTTVLCGEQYPTLSLVIPLIRGLQHSLQNMVTKTDCGQMLKTNLIEVISRRLGLLEQNEIVAKATFLDPRFKKIGFGLEDNAKKAVQWISEELSQLISSKEIADAAAEVGTTAQSTQHESNSSDIWAFFDSKMEQIKNTTSSTSSASVTIRQYLQLPYLKRLDNPLEFWKKHKLMFPELYELALKYLCIPATSVPSERVFSKAGQLTNIRRNRLLPKNLDMIIFLNSADM